MTDWCILDKLQLNLYYAATLQDETTGRLFEVVVQEVHLKNIGRGPGFSPSHISGALFPKLLKFLFS